MRPSIYLFGASTAFADKAVVKRAYPMKNIMLRAVRADPIPIKTLTRSAGVAAALQVHMARGGAQLDAAKLEPVADDAAILALDLLIRKGGY